MGLGADLSVRPQREKHVSRDLTFVGGPSIGQKTPSEVDPFYTILFAYLFENGKVTDVLRLSSHELLADGTEPCCFGETTRVRRVQRLDDQLCDRLDRILQGIGGDPYRYRSWSYFFLHCFGFPLHQHSACEDFPPDGVVIFMLIANPRLYPNVRPNKPHFVGPSKDDG